MRPPHPPLLHRPVPLAVGTRKLRPPGVRRAVSPNIPNRYPPRRSVHHNARESNLALHVDVPGGGHSAVIQHRRVVDS